MRDFDGAEGVELRLQAPSVRTTALERLVSARAQFAILDIHDLARARERGRDVVGVMAIVQRPLAAVVAGRSVQAPARRARGRARGRFGRAGGRRGAGGDRAPRRRRRPDGAAGAGSPAARPPPRCSAAGWRPRWGVWDTDGVALLAARPGAHAFRADDYGAPAYPGLVLCVMRETLRDSRPVVRATVAAIRRGYQEALVDPSRRSARSSTARAGWTAPPSRRRSTRSSRRSSRA